MTNGATVGDEPAALAPEMHRASVAFNVSVFALGSLIAVETLHVWWAAGPDHRLLLALGICLPLGLVLSRFPMLVSRNVDGIVVPFEPLLLVYLLTTTPRLTALLAWVVTVAVAYLTERRSWQNRLLNTGSALVSSLAATVALTAVAGPQPVSARQLLAVLTGAAAYYVCDYALSAGSVSITQRSSWWREVRGSVGGVIGGGLFLLVATLGYLAAAVQLTMSAWTAVLMLVPILAVVAAAYTSRTAEDRRTQQHQLFQASVEIYEAATRVDMLGALQVHGAAVVSSGRLVLREVAPGDGELGCVLPFTRPELWLVTRRNKAVENLRYDEAALRSLASLGAAALERVTLTEDAEHRAGHDELTGLPNRRSLTTHLTSALTPGTGDGATVLFVDLDGFKGVNDGLGHAAGDELLTAVARRLRVAVESVGTSYRLGGDEFAVLVAGRDLSVAAEVSDRIVTALGAPFAVAAGPARIGASVGAASGGPGEDVDTLLSRADHAMYSAKRAGGCRSVLAGDDPAAPQRSSSSPVAR